MVAVTQSGSVLVDALRSLGGRFSNWDAAMGWIFTVLGVTTALFVRVRQRRVKIGAVIAVGIAGTVIAARSLWEGFGLFPILGISFCILLFLTVPLLLRTVLGHDNRPEEPLPS
jgi:hypothetical protein